jgi:hypothetical protein
MRQTRKGFPQISTDKKCNPQMAQMRKDIFYRNLIPDAQHDDHRVTTLPVVGLSHEADQGWGRGRESEFLAFDIN